MPLSTVGRRLSTVLTEPDPAMLCADSYFFGAIASVSEPEMPVLSCETALNDAA